MAQRYPTKMLDRSLAAMESLFTCIIQLEMEFDHGLDAQRLARAVALTMDAEPLLGCRFAPGFFRPYWEPIDKEQFDVFTVVTDADEYEAFKAKGIDFFTGPQLLVCLFRSESVDRLTLKVSHLVSDAAGVKDVGATLAEIYNRLKQEPDYLPAPAACDARGLWLIIRHVPWTVYPRIMFNYLQENSQAIMPYKTHGVPVAQTSATAGRTVTRHIEKNEFARIIHYAKKHDATINDMLLAAIFRALSKIGQWDRKAALRIAMTIDLRRYLPDKKAKAITNFSSIEMLTYGTAVEETFEATMARVAGMVNKRKASWLGLSAFVSAGIAMWSMPFFALKSAIQKGMGSKFSSANAFDWFTNMGQISADSVRFGKEPTRAWLLPPGCNHQVFFYGCSSYGGALTLSASIMPDGDGINERVTNLFFDYLVSEMQP